MTISARSVRCTAGLALVALLVAACNDNELGVEKRHPNRAPVTVLSNGPPDSTDNFGYQVQFFWYGTDEDGTVDHFDYILLDHPKPRDCYDCPGDPDQVQFDVPTADDPRWTATTDNDTLIVVRADTLRANPAPEGSSEPPEDNDVTHDADSLLAINFERWHTFFLRAVDNEGEVDPSPEYLTFNAKTMAPTAQLTAPISPQEPEFTGPMVIVFNWTGQDPVGGPAGENVFLEPIASRSTWVRSLKRPDGKFEGYPHVFYTLPDSAWTEWKRWDAADGSGKQRIVTFPDNISDGQGKGYFMFAVQTMDEAGAITPVFDARGAGKNNVVRVVVRGGEFGATLIVTERFLGTFSFVGQEGTTDPLSVAAGQPVQFRWRGDASSYGGSIVAYRYGWNIQNPDDDEQWEQNWCETCTRAPTRTFNSGTQRFFLEVRDNAESVTHCEIPLVVYQVTRRRDLLIVDDTANFIGDVEQAEAREDAAWRSVVEELRTRRPFLFDPTDPSSASDVYDVNIANMNQSPPIGKVFDYKTIVWYAKIAGAGASALTDVAVFFDPFAADAANQVPKFNYLNTYVDNGGEIWVSGQQPTDRLWRFPASSGSRPYPFNVTNWHVDTHPPGEDSVGVASFLWRLGAEAVDLGGGGRGPFHRDNPNHYCLGFRRAVPPDSTQRFQSSLQEEHTHDLLVQTRDIDLPPPGGVTYTTAMAPGFSHTHTVTLTQAQLRQLAGGDRLMMVPTSVESGDTPAHQHTFDLVDQVGLWGAPPRLEPDGALWGVNGRHSVEIYNMPTFLFGETPALNPDPRIWEALYTYISPPATATLLYPQGVNGQPAFIIRKTLASDRFFSRAYCGFEVWRLQPASHLAIADFILLRHFRLGLPDGS